MTSSTPPRLRLSALDRTRDGIYRYGILVVFVGIIAWFSIALPFFPTVFNAFQILQAVSVTAIIALGVTISLSIDGFDLSVGSNVSLTVMLTAAAQVFWDLPWWLALIIGLAVGAGVGLVNALLVVVARVPDLLATLGTMFLFAGLALIVTQGQSVARGVPYNGQPTTGSFDPVFRWLGTGKIFDTVPFSVVVLVVLGIVVTVFLSLSRPGRILQAIGSNPEATRLAGVRVARYRMLAYLLSGLLASVGGILVAAREGRGNVSVGGDELLEAVAAALIGFAVLGANRPNALGTLFGALFVGVLFNGLNQMSVPYYTADFIKGALLVGALVLSFSTLFRRKELG
jgi:simple sugar transport system permease protein